MSVRPTPTKQGWLSTVTCVVEWVCPCGVAHRVNTLTQPPPICACGNVWHISMTDGLNIGYEPPAPALVPAQDGPTLWEGAGEP